MKAKDFKPSRLQQMNDVTPMPTSWAWLVNYIKGDALKNNTEVYRQRLAQLDQTTDAAERKAIKDQLSEIKRRTGGFFPHAVLIGGRQERHASQTSNHIMVDIDNIAAEEFDGVRQRLKEWEHTFLLYTTYSGRGLRLIVRVDGEYGVGQFRGVWQWVNDLVELIAEVPVDRQCADITRFSGLAHDADVVYNEESPSLTLPKGERTATSSLSRSLPQGEGAANASLAKPTKGLPLGGWLEGASLDDIAERVKKIVEDHGCIYAEGHHNEYIYRCMYLMNNFGVPEDEAMQWALREFADYSARSVRATVRCCYRKTNEHGTYGIKNSKLKTQNSNCYNVTNVTRGGNPTHTRDINNVEEMEVALPQPPTFADYQWPRLLQQAIDCADSAPRRDLVFIGMVTVLGASLSRTVRFLYGKRWMYPSLQVLGVAPPASGKGVLTWVRRIVEPIHERMLALYRKAMSEYDKERAAYDVAGKAKANMKQPEQPPMRMFLIAGNNSATGVLENLMDANGIGLICESEADTVSTAIGTDYGHWSDTLRKAFDHDRIAYNRRANKEYREVGELRLSVLLSGTPAQVQPLIPSAENGLFSRQLFYSLPSSNEWRSQFSDTDSDDVDSTFKSWGRDWANLIDQLQRSVSVLTLKLTDEQRKEFDSMFNDFFASANSTQEGAMKSWVARLAINLMRIMSVVAFARLLDDGWSNDIDFASIKGITPASDIVRENVKDGTCTRYDYGISADDFHAVLGLARPLYLHACYVLTLLPKTEVASRKMKAGDALLVELGSKFSIEDAYAVGKAMGLSEGTVRTRLSRMANEGIIVSPSRGVYVLARACEDVKPM